MSDEWWRNKIPKAEMILWHGQPYKGYFPPRLRWAYGILIVGLALGWIASPWFADSLRDYWKLVSCTLLLAFFMWWDRLTRRRRMYVVTTSSAWWISEIFKPRRFAIDSKSNFYCNGRNIVFSHLRFLVFEHLSDPDAALAALTQAREAQT